MFDEWIKEAEGKATKKTSPKKARNKSGFPDWLSEGDAIIYDGALFVKVSTNKGGANNLSGKKQVCIIPDEVVEQLALTGVSNQNAIAGLLVWGINELKKQDKVLVLDFSSYGKTKKI